MPGDLHQQVLLAYLTSLTWTSGLIVDVLGALLMLRAVSLAPVSVVQPVSACGLAILALFSHFYLKENMQEGDWLGVALAAAGTIGGTPWSDLQIQIRYNPEIHHRHCDCYCHSLLMFIALNGYYHSDFDVMLLVSMTATGPFVYGAVGICLMHALWVVYARKIVYVNGKQSAALEIKVLCLLKGTMEAVVDRWAQIQKHWKRYHQMDVVAPLGGKESADVLEEITTGAEAGACFGLSAAMARTGFLLAQSGYPRLCIPVGIAFSISLSSGGFLCQTRGLKEGRAVVVSTCAAVASIVTGVLVGMVALGESLPQSFLLRFIRFLSWMLIVGGVVLLVNMGKPTMLRRYMRRYAEFSSAAVNGITCLLEVGVVFNLVLSAL
ncbi:hypothetical protein CBR_g50008 [Chara braunii]|uniref:Probable magnesium transporter n=1 Tax=Chara braunii TaxID=69332 RepID=A0A388K592_CHABU|nr:hypothetical protein CBR_g50008 [Chara braunii]|eukprot:GBG65217.1 hypothetical protein CBR_g50008 [Chara braunii]